MVLDDVKDVFKIIIENIFAKLELPITKQQRLKYQKSKISNQLEKINSELGE